MKQDGGAVTIASLLSFFENENKTVSRGEYHFKSDNVESFSASQGVFKGQVHVSITYEESSVKCSKWPTLN